ncbi:RsmE family RNA methyltransferase [Occallatibacter savannae]|uniref:RsmE family RNA methyltransferase n=1 Tax=Occallatibacter savannae TaxID=1002691 RepID=UPI000D69DE27|nr:RsmE family RNA methyltransferase [Occallatibacter savannae]
MTRRRWIAERWDKSTASLAGAQAEHLIRVLRVKEGTEADVVAGGRVFHAVVSRFSDAGAGASPEVSFNLLSELESEPAMPVTLVMSIFKFDHMEWAIEKATELGVASIVPVIARRTDKHLAQAAMKRVERWRRIAHEASQQSRRSDVPLICDPVKLADRIKAASNLKRVVLAEQERATTLRRFLEAALAAPAVDLPQFEIAIGPEGGWAPEEAALFDANVWKAVSLGPRILRAETAAIAALSVIGSMLD